MVVVMLGMAAGDGHSDTMARMIAMAIAMAMYMVTVPLFYSCWSCRRLLLWRGSEIGKGARACLKLSSQPRSAEFAVQASFASTAEPMTVEPTRAATPTWQTEAQLLMNVNCEALKHKQSNSAQTRRDGGSVRRRCPSFPLCQGGATDPWGPRVCVACNQTYNRDVVWWDEGLGHMCYGPGATNTQIIAECPTTAYTPRASAAHAGAGGRQSQYAVCR